MKPKKNKAAQALARLANASMTPEQRRERGRKGGLAAAAKRGADGHKALGRLGGLAKAAKRAK